MSEHYQVLARKYRPHNFSELVGQIHTVKALTNALDNNNLHHGFLFTGTRGVGKTTIARIFAKAINCEVGISANPCGKCTTCVEIDQAQSIDLIELDAASHTGVDNIRTILENAQYMPSKNRYKIYLIDEVHMLSLNSFNALLKTLEEPPSHIKFLLATTNPQKLPITILSRCLQFNLQKLELEEISGQLKFIMQAEKLKFEESALTQIADLGNGSMRDALSLLDQSIAYGNGSVLSKDIKAMLGLVQHNDIIKLAEYIFSGDGKNVIDFIKILSHKGENLTHALKDLTHLLHQISIAKIIADSQMSAEIKTLAKQISHQDCQLFYQIAVNGSRDLAYAPSEQIGVEMTLLRMLCFRSANETLKKKTKITAETLTQKVTQTLNNQEDWETLAKSLAFTGATQTLIKNTLFDDFSDNILSLSLDDKFSNLLTEHTEAAIQKILQAHFGKIDLKIHLNKPKTQTLAQKENQQQLQKTKKMQQQFLTDPGVQKLQDSFAAKVELNSIKEI